MELRTMSKKELIEEITLLQEEVDGLWATKERYKKSLKEAGLYVPNLLETTEDDLNYGDDE